MELAFKFNTIPYLKRLLRGISGAKVWDYILNITSIEPAQVREEITQFIKPVLSRIGRPKIILEIGAARGGTLYILTRIATKDSIIVSIDLPRAPFGGGCSKWKERIYKAFFRKEQKLHLVRANSHNLDTLNKVKRILADRPIDLLFIDGDHTYVGVKMDFEMYRPLVRKGGIIAFHDIVPHPPETGLRG